MAASYLKVFANDGTCVRKFGGNTREVRNKYHEWKKSFPSLTFLMFKTKSRQVTLPKIKELSTKQRNKMYELVGVHCFQAQNNKQ